VLLLAGTDTRILFRCRVSKVMNDPAFPDLDVARPGVLRTSRSSVSPTCPQINSFHLTQRLRETGAFGCNTRTFGRFGELTSSDRFTSLGSKSLTECAGFLDCFLYPLFFHNV